ncbi:MAG TPA: DUF3795 domain-containing protein [Clostridia bacterium]|nr:DUF3795 domain-containing protein [Clostridia bacterium]
MVESRCGLLCSKCEFREQMNCKGCISTKTMFWGECQVKTCCEAKALSNCGECPEMPCKLLNDFSYDKEHGDNGARIQQCRKWKEEGRS